MMTGGTVCSGAVNVHHSHGVPAGGWGVVTARASSAYALLRDYEGFHLLLYATPHIQAAGSNRPRAPRNS